MDEVVDRPESVQEMEAAVRWRRATMNAGRNGSEVGVGLAWRRAVGWLKRMIDGWGWNAGRRCRMPSGWQLSRQGCTAVHTSKLTRDVWPVEMFAVPTLAGF